MRAFDWSIRVYYEDTDAGGVVFYANYLKFMERARTEMLRDQGFEQDLLRAQQGILFVVRSVRIDYLKPAHFNDLLLIRSELLESKKTRLIFKQSVIRNEQILCDAEVCVACLDAATMRPTAIPTTILNSITQ